MRVSDQELRGLKTALKLIEIAMEDGNGEHFEAWLTIDGMIKQAEKSRPKAKAIINNSQYDFMKTPVGQYDLDGNLIKAYSGIRDAARAINKNSSGIVFCVNGYRQMAYGYKWKRVPKEWVK